MPNIDLIPARRMPEHRILVVLVTAVIAIWGSAWALIGQFLPTWEDRGQFGDLFGAVNALFSGLAFAGLFYTIFLQQRQVALQQQQLLIQQQELKLQREEMKASRVELKNQANAQLALVKATIAQIAVSGLNAQIEADKLKTVGQSDPQRNELIKNIESIGQAISDLSGKLDQQLQDEA